MFIVELIGVIMLCFFNVDIRDWVDVVIDKDGFLILMIW